ncbi:MAG: DNA alkylation repair protein, partial [Gammaproteobacteria bacterium]
MKRIVTHLIKLQQELQQLANPKQKEILQRFFKTGVGEYGEGDVFIGVRVPEQRKVAKQFMDLSLEDTKELINSKIHEHRLTALLILVQKFEKADEKLQKRIIDLYIKNTQYINNWDLVDLSAPKLLGEYLVDKDRRILYKLARSKSLWEKRIAILSTYAFIRNKNFDDALKLSEILLYEKHDLMHKAVGWMLREIGNRDLAAEERFLKKYYKQMPRTMLR